MEKFKGTQGRWKAGYWLDNEASVMQDSPSLTRICKMEYVVKEGAVPNDEMEANADLIAAAPDLLAALQGVLKVADRATDEFDAARAAIAKALGQ